MKGPLPVIRFVLKEAKPHKWSLLLITLIMLVYVAADFVHPFVYREIINTVSDPGLNPETAFSGLIILIMALAGSILVNRLFRDVAAFILARVETHTMERVASKVFAYVARLSYKFHTSTFAGSTSRKINRGVSKIEDVMDVLFYDLTPITITMITASVILLRLHLFIGIPLIIGLIIFTIVSILLVKKRMKYDEERNERETVASGTMIDSITNNLTVKTFTGEDSETNLYKRKNRLWGKAAIKAWDWETYTAIFQGGFIGILEIILIIISLTLWRDGVFNVGDIVFVQGNIGLLIFPMWTLGRFYRRFRRAEVDINDMLELTRTPIEIKSLKNAKVLNTTKGSIEFKDVCFNYEKSGRIILKNLSLKIKPGEKIALVGPSGAGKSTFIKLLFRFVDPLYGKILIDNQNIKKVNVKSLRECIGLVPQEPLLFHRSIEDNIRYGNHGASHEDVVKAAKMAYAHEFIETLDEGYHSLVGERGIKLSGGERQRVALARVFLENAPILVLDEATSSLDSISEGLIQEALDKLMKGRTTIVIAHRLSTIMKMDRIIVLKKGEVVEEGSHKELLNKKNSLYKTLWESQAGGFLG
jgi:ATP-binding cassette subfamily B protein